jgi:hypothetical protein
MTFVEQHKMVQQLRSKTLKMTDDEKTLFEMIVKRDKDDEELDVISMAKLKNIYEKYFPKHSKVSIEEKWKKLTRK